MNELITGKEALIALANGEEVEYFDDKLNEWVYMDMNHHFKREFRLKSRTIIINGIEVPAPFEPKHGEIFWYIDVREICSYNHKQEWSDSDEYLQLGAWRTEEEIKQVVAALRKVFKGE